MADDFVDNVKDTCSEYDAYVAERVWLSLFKKYRKCRERWQERFRRRADRGLEEPTDGDEDKICCNRRRRLTLGF